MLVTRDNTSTGPLHGFKLCLCDFGQTKLVCEKDLVAGRKKILNNAITARYTSPEGFGLKDRMNVVESEEDMDVYFKVDVYALSVSLFELMTQSRPWLNCGPDDIAAMVIAGSRPEWPAAINEKLIPLKGLIEKGWEHAYRDRVSVFEMLDTVYDWTEK